MCAQSETSGWEYGRVCAYDKVALRWQKAISGCATESCLICMYPMNRRVGDALLCCHRVSAPRPKAPPVLVDPSPRRCALEPRKRDCQMNASDKRSSMSFSVQSRVGKDWRNIIVSCGFKRNERWADQQRELMCLCAYAMNGFREWESPRRTYLKVHLDELIGPLH